MSSASIVLDKPYGERNLRNEVTNIGTQKLEGVRGCDRAPAQQATERGRCKKGISHACAAEYTNALISEFSGNIRVRINLTLRYHDDIIIIALTERSFR
jgi:hypothetical protein